jgi:predicted AAA+ superfamily ATPase
MSKKQSWTPTESDYMRILEEQNPWHKLNRVPDELAPPVRRPMAEVLWQLMLNPPLPRYQIILGPRRVGKTTVMYQTVRQMLAEGVEAKRLWWLRLDHPLLLDLQLGNLVQWIIHRANATAKSPAYLFLDEITYADKWDLWLKTFFDERWPIRLVGTSSATAAIRQRGTESGVGRWEEQFLAPYLFTEYLSLVEDGSAFPCKKSLAATIEEMIDLEYLPPGITERRRRFTITGGFPELLLQKELGDEASQLFRSQRILRTDAIEKAIYKDIPQAFQVLEPAKLERLLYALAGQITGIFSPATIATDLSLTEPTIDKYVRYFERAFLVFMLPTYAPTEEAVQRRGRKLYFVDGAVRNAALLRGLAPLEDPAEMGLLIDNMAAAHLYSLCQQSGVRLYHWRHKGAEVDLVFDHPDEPLAFEITGSSKHHLKGLNEFQERFPKFRGACYLVSSNTVFERPTINSPGRIPFDMFLMAVGLQTQKALEKRIGVRLAKNGQYMLFRK